MNLSRCINGSCSNTVGDFKCTCPDGFKLADDKVTCEGEGIFHVHIQRERGFYY